MKYNGKENRKKFGIENKIVYLINGLAMDK
jgi:hypothetical protein